jgi:hypothetical protein
VIGARVDGTPPQERPRRHVHGKPSQTSYPHLTTHSAGNVGRQVTSLY